MTIGIAAVCDSGRAVVVCADRRLKCPDNPGVVEDSTDCVKILTPNHPFPYVALLSGEGGHGAEVLEEAIPVLRAPNFSVARAPDVVRQAYARTRERKAVEELSPSIGPALEDYQTKLEPLRQQIAATLAQYNLNVNILIAGFDGAAFLSHIGHPGVFLPLPHPDYAAIGCGRLHALLRLILGQHNRQRSVKETLALVYSAKRAAERMLWVGPTTDMMVIDESGVHTCSQGVLPAEGA